MKINKRKKTKILLSSLFIYSGAIALTTPLIISYNISNNLEVSNDRRTVDDSLQAIDTSPGWHAMHKYGTDEITKDLLKSSNSSLRKGGKFSVTDFEIEFDKMKVTDFLPLQSTAAFQSFINDYWRVMFSWGKNEWSDMIKAFQVEYSVSEDQRSVDIKLQWKNNTPQYWYCDFSINGFLSPDGSLNPEGIPSYVWYIVGGIGGLIILVALIVLIVLIIKKQDKLDKYLKKMATKKVQPPKMLSNQQSPSQALPNNGKPSSNDQNGMPTRNPNSAPIGPGTQGIQNNRGSISQRPSQGAMANTPSRQSFARPRPGLGAQRPSINVPPPPPPPKIEVEGPPKSFAPKRK